MYFFDLIRTTCTNTHITQFYAQFQGITNNIYDFGRPFLFLHFVYPSTQFLHVHIRFYPSKWRVGRSLHKAMLACHGLMTVVCVLRMERRCRTRPLSSCSMNSSTWATSTVCWTYWPNASSNWRGSVLVAGGGQCEWMEDLVWIFTIIFSYVSAACSVVWLTPTRWCCSS